MTTVVPKTWNERLSQAREMRGIKKIDFADSVGVSTATTTDWENGEIKSLSADKLLAICDVLQISPYWLMRGVGDSVEEVELVTCYRSATDEGKTSLLRFARLEKKSNEPKS